jgi:sortase A
VRLCLRLSGQLLGTLAVVVLGFAAYLYWGTAIRAAAAQRAYARELTSQWSGTNQLAALADASDLRVGRPFALLRIPQFGPRWQLAVVQGIGLAELALAPGHVPSSALPGQVGNFVVAANRVTAGNPFWSLASLRRGAMLIVVTIDASYEYQVTSGPTAEPVRDSAALAPVPNHPGKLARLRMITLITSDPPWTGTSRIVVTGVLVRALPRQQGS